MARTRVMKRHLKTDRHKTNLEQEQQADVVPRRISKNKRGRHSRMMMEFGIEYSDLLALFRKYGMDKDDE